MSIPSTGRAWVGFLKSLRILTLVWAGVAAVACGDEPPVDLFTDEAGETALLAAPHDCVVPNATIVNRGHIIYQGTVDVTPSITRVLAGVRLPYPHDGVVFSNREHRLPRAAPRWYREYVDPTPGIAGPGPQRLVRGGEEVWYYTPDHYDTFALVNCQ